MSDKCGSCNGTINTRKPSVSCSGFCEASYHVQCIKIPEDIIAAVSKYPALSWRCENCLKKVPTCDPKRLEIILEEKFSSLLQEVTEKFHSLKNEITHSAAKLVSDINAEKEVGIKKTYSAALKTEAAIIIKPKDQTQKNSITKSDILSNVNPIDNNINISRVRNVKDGGILVGCSTIEEVSKLRNIAKNKLDQNYDIKDVKNLNPRVRIVGMSEKLEENDVIEYIKFQNKQLTSENFECKVLKLWPTKKNVKIYQAILQVDTHFYNKVMSVGEGKVFIGFDLCNVYDSIDIRRCFKCSGFNHISNQCKSKISCPVCAGEHYLKDCNTNLLKCANCVDYSSTNKIVLDVEHAAWDHNCFVYKQKISEFKANMSFSA